MIQYQTHADFMPSLRNFYLKNGNYRKAANKVLAAWAKSQNPNFFAENQIFQGLNLTHHGENRVQHCYKYDLYNASRLVTQQYKDTCTFLFVGTHEEVEEWLEKNCGLIKIPYLINPYPPDRDLPPATYTRTRLQELKAAIDKYKLDIAQYETYFKDTDINFETYNSAAKKNLVNQFSTKNIVSFKNQLNTIKRLTIGGQSKKAIEYAEELEMFTDFIKIKINYIATLKQYLDISSHLH
ncbi:MAG: hypothetical protein E6Q83_13245 [Thiothrix sp.]|nr:MAG: hypothetical protein E6Q83_13245 [Thiothrix sp.]